MRLDDCIKEYLVYGEVEKGLAETTLTNYQAWLHHYTDWLRANGYPDPDLCAFATPILRRYQYAKSKEGVRPRTILSAFHPLRGLGVYLVAQGYLTTNPVSALQMPKKDAAIRLTVTDQEVAALFQACDRQRTNRQIALSRAVLSSLCHGGLRREEACCLQVTDLDVSQKSLLVRSGKGNKSRKLYICQEGVSAMQEWLAVREQDCAHPYLFAVDRARRLHHTGIASLIETIKATAGLRGNEAVKPHSLRHWCATNLLRNGANIRDIQQFLGHADLATTARYLHSNEEQLKDISELTALKSPPLPPPTSQPTRPAGAHRPANTQHRVRTIMRGAK
jgi:integrase/recombinase XerD